jgi:hypothetical protein
MPSPVFIKQLALTRFQGFQIKLPAQAAVALGGGLTLTKGTVGATLTRAPSGFTTAKIGGTAPMAVPAALFLAASTSAGDVATQKAMRERYTQLFDGLSEAIRFAWDRFRQQACFKNLRITAVTVIGTPGCLDGPELEPLIKSAPATIGWTGSRAVVRDAVAAGFAACWKDWQHKVTVPGLPWYPAFAAFPGPVAPPMPNVPMPLVACVSAGLASMSVLPLKASLSQRLSGKLDFHEQFSDALATMLATAFTTWLASQMVTNVLGKGPVPSFAPPYVPVGPVVGGDNLAIPGHLMA